jgi:hypothetical protein|tara:strand:- start:267 stop:443 length:177 start_codon:yes stop_codon:yes gene_type:complete
MNPDKINIAPEREFEYEKISRTIDKMDDIEDVKLLLKYTIKMGMKQTEILGKMILMPF